MSTGNENKADSSPKQRKRGKNSVEGDHDPPDASRKKIKRAQCNFSKDEDEFLLKIWEEVESLSLKPEEKSNLKIKKFKEEFTDAKQTDFQIRKRGAHVNSVRKKRMKVEKAEDEESVMQAASRLSELDPDVDELASRLTETETNLLESTNKYAAAEEELKALKKKIATLEISSQQDKISLSEANAQVKTLEEQVKQLKTQKELEVNTQITELQTKLEEAEKKITELQQKEEKHVQANQELAKSNTNIAKLQADLNEAEKKIRELPEKTQIHVQVDGELAQSKTKIAALEKNLEKAENKKSELQKSLKEFEDAKIRIKALLNKKDEKFDLVEQFKVLQENYDRASKLQQGQKCQLNNEKRILQDEIKTLKAQLASENNKICGTEADYKTKISQIQNKLKIVEDERDEARNELEKYPYREWGKHGYFHQLHCKLQTRVKRVMGYHSNAQPTSDIAFNLNWMLPFAKLSDQWFFEEEGRRMSEQDYDEYEVTWMDRSKRYALFRNADSHEEDVINRTDALKIMSLKEFQEVDRWFQEKLLVTEKAYQKGMWKHVDRRDLQEFHEFLLANKMQKAMHYAKKI